MNDSLNRIRDDIAAIAHHIDRKRWPELTALFAAVVETDYTSLFGGAPVRQSAEILVAGWRSALEHVTTQHLLGPIAVRMQGASAAASCHVRAFHHRAGAADGEDWEVLGHYRFELASPNGKWEITRMMLETFHQLGNKKLLAG